MWPVHVVTGKTSFTNEDDPVQALKKMDERHEDKGVGKEDNANDKATNATEDNESDKVTDAGAKGGVDERDGDCIAESSGGGDPSHGEGVMEPNGDGDGNAGKMDEGESPPKADEGMVCTDEKEGTKEVDQPMGAGEQEGEAKPMEDVMTSPAPQVTQVWPWRKRGTAMRHPTRTDRTRRVWMQRKSYGVHQLRND